MYNGRKRTFFYLVYSGFRYVQSLSNSLVSIPPVAFRDGNFSSLVGSSGKPILIYDPSTTTATASGGYTRTPFPGNQIPQSEFSSVSSKILPLLPQPTNAANLNNFLALSANSFSRDQVDLKIDHSFTDANRLSGFLYVGRYAQINPDTLPDPFTNGLNNDYDSRWARLSDDWSPSSTLLNHAAFGFTREAQLWNSLAANQNWPTQIGLTGVQTGAGNAFPYVTFNDGYATWGSTNGTKTVGQQINNVFQFDDSVGWMRGRHSLKFGADARWLETNGADYFGSQGNFAFNTLETGLPGTSSTGSAFASFLLGDVHQGQLNQLTLVPGIRYRYLAGFAQDDWKISRTLTLNLGPALRNLFPALRGARQPGELRPNARQSRRRQPARRNRVSGHRPRPQRVDQFRQYGLQELRAARGLRLRRHAAGPPCTADTGFITGRAMPTPVCGNRRVSVSASTHRRSSPAPTTASRRPSIGTAAFRRTTSARPISAPL